jgi:hypothetical protein
MAYEGMYFILKNQPRWHGEDANPQGGAEFGAK